jgi:hypothetical protein
MQEYRFVQDGREKSKLEGVPQIESRCEDLMLAALDNLSFLTLSKKASSLFVRNFSIDNSCFELPAFRAWSLVTKSAVTPPSVSVN